MNLSAQRSGNRERKLISVKGTLLGHIAIPEWVNKYLNERGVVQFPGETPRVTLFAPANYNTSMKIGILENQYVAYEYPEGVHLHGISIEELERLEGFAFYPGAAYLRSLIE